jgi:hypothetical protein
MYVKAISLRILLLDKPTVVSSHLNLWNKYFILIYIQVITEAADQARILLCFFNFRGECHSIPIEFSFFVLHDEIPPIKELNGNTTDYYCGPQ